MLYPKSNVRFGAFRVTAMESSWVNSASLEIHSILSWQIAWEDFITKCSGYSASYIFTLSSETSELSVANPTLFSRRPIWNFKLLKAFQTSQRFTDN